MTSSERVLLPHATGFCSMCDSRFRDEPALAWQDQRVAGGWVYIELRHVEDESALAVAGDRVAGA